jgi:hypothetical protein
MATIPIPLDLESATVGTSNIPEKVLLQGTNSAVPAWAFGVANEAIFVRFKAYNYGSGNLTLKLIWAARTAGTLSGSVTWGGSIMALTPGDTQSILTDAFATETTQSTTTSGNANAAVETTITLTNLDSIAANDWVTIRLRATAFSSFTGDALLLDAGITYSD